MQEFEPYLFRAVEARDLDAIFAFSKVAGLTNLPPDRALLRANIQRSMHAFTSPRLSPLPDDFYFFVMENIHTHSLIGCCALYADIGTKPPFYSFQHNKEQHTLLLNSSIRHVSEMAALYLSDEHRKHHMGAFLSRARYLWIASQRERFHGSIIAEMRGHIDKHNENPFWTLFSHQFFPNQEFEQADLEVAAHHTKFIDKHIPHHPIAIDTLDKRAQACMGMTHTATRAAMNLLELEGFIKTDYINVFDGGPILEAKTNKIRTITHSTRVKLAGIRKPTSARAYFIATVNTPFFVSLATVDIDKANHCCYLDAHVMEKMQLKIHDTLCVSPF